MMSRQIESTQGEIKGNLKGKPRGNLECGSTQLSLFYYIFGWDQKHDLILDLTWILLEIPYNAMAIDFNSYCPDN